MCKCECTKGDIGRDDVAVCRHCRSSRVGRTCSQYWCAYFDQSRNVLGITSLFEDIRTVPTIKTRLHPVFAKECREAIRLAQNLASFKCTVPGVLPIFLPALQAKERLERVVLHANLNSDTAKMLAKLTTLQSLTLEFATWNVVDCLPTWCQTLAPTLTSLSLFVRHFSSLLNHLSHAISDDQRAPRVHPRISAQGAPQSPSPAHYWVSQDRPRRYNATSNAHASPPESIINNLSELLLNLYNPQSTYQFFPRKAHARWTCHPLRSTTCATWRWTRAIINRRLQRLPP